MVAAQNLNRKWIGVDIGEQAAKLVAQRLQDDFGLFTDFMCLSAPHLPRTDIKFEAPTKNVKQRLHKEQGGKCNACAVEMELRHFHLDHIIPSSKGGQDTYSNYQLLCGNCNTRKGDRPMEHLMAKLNKEKEAEFRYNYTRPGNKLPDKIL